MHSIFNNIFTLRIFSKLLVACIFFLIFMGALVTSHQAGLSVPDWPTTYGENMFLFPIEKWQGGIFYEHSHRLMASVVGLLTTVLFIWTLLKELRKWVKVTTCLAMAAVILQGTLGGLTVLFRLPTAVSMSHAILAQTFLVLCIIIAYAHSAEINTCKAQNSNIKLFELALFMVIVVYIQLFLGALMRHTHSGLAIPDFPTMAGSIFPRFNQNSLTIVNSMLSKMGQASVGLDQMGIHFAHRIGAAVVFISAVFVSIKIFLQKNPLLF